MLKRGVRPSALAPGCMKHVLAVAVLVMMLECQHTSACQPRPRLALAPLGPAATTGAATATAWTPLAGALAGRATTQPGPATAAATTNSTALQTTTTAQTAWLRPSRRLTSHPKPAQLLHHISRSDVFHCTLTGIANASSAAPAEVAYSRLHVFLRMRRLPAGACGGVDFRHLRLDRSGRDVVAVRGFTFLEHLYLRQGPDLNSRSQLWQALVASSWQPQVFLRPSGSLGRSHFPLRYSYDPLVPEMPSTLDAEFALPPPPPWKRGVSARQGDPGADGGAPEPAGAMEFLLGVEGWDQYCSFIATAEDLRVPPAARPAPPPGAPPESDARCPADVPFIQEPAAAESAEGASATAGETQPLRALKSAPGLAATDAGPRAAGLRAQQVQAQHRALQTAAQVVGSSDSAVGGAVRMGEEGGTILFMSLFFTHGVRQTVTVLLYHLLWHLRMGVTAYWIYVSERAVDFSSDPRLMRYLAEGTVRILYWDLMPRFRSTSVRHSFQALYMNHGLLSLWGLRDVTLLAIDPDEYVMSPPGPGPFSVSPVVPSMRDIQRRCGGHGAASALLIMERHRVVCLHCQKRPLDTWLDRRMPSGAPRPTHRLPGLEGQAWAGGVLAPQTFQHPLLRYMMTTTKEERGKALFSAANMRTFRVHTGNPSSGYTGSAASPQCAVIAHVGDLFHMGRYVGWRPIGDRTVTEDPAWWAPALEPGLQGG